MLSEFEKKWTSAVRIACALAALGVAFACGDGTALRFEVLAVTAGVRDPSRMRERGIGTALAPGDHTSEQLRKKCAYYGHGHTPDHQVTKQSLGLRSVSDGRDAQST